MNRSADRALVRAARDGDTRSIARLTTLFEDSRPETSDRRVEILNGLRAFGEPSVIVGFTGSPEAGKSSLIAALVPMLRAKSDVRIAVIAVDPSSTLSGGSLLGDRARIRGASERTFFRSQAAESTLGGLAASTFEVCRALEYLFDLIVLETVGVGQSESAVRALVSRLYLVMQPRAGDRIQHLKAGLFESPRRVRDEQVRLGPGLGELRCPPSVAPNYHPEATPRVGDERGGRLGPRSALLRRTLSRP
jgi:LAO/AO transport system kinase